MPKRSAAGNGNKSMWNAGKGDGERSSGWRKNYHEIAWPDGGQRLATDGFTQRGGKLVKHYGMREPEKNI